MRLHQPSTPLREPGLGYSRGIIGLAIVTAAFIAACYILLSRQQRLLDDYSERLTAGTALCLSSQSDASELEQLLTTDHYITDTDDARCIAEWIVGRLSDGTALPNLGALNRHDFAMPAAHAEAHGGMGLRARVAASRARLGMTDTIAGIYADTSLISALNHQAKARVLSRDSAAFSHPTMPVSVSIRAGTESSEGIIVALTRYDSTSATVLYAMTDAMGQTIFDVPAGWYYSVLPIREGYEYGRARGTSEQAHHRATSYRFVQREHTLTPLTPQAYRQLRDNKALTVRTPDAYVRQLQQAAVLFVAAWWLAFFFLGWIDKRRLRSSDRMLLLLLATLTGFTLVMMFAIVDPLVDKPLGTDMATGIAVGVLAMCLGSLINVTQLLRHSRFLQWGGMIIALLLVLALYLFGSGPEGSDAKVNLGFFQPSELSKYLIVVAIAAFFASPRGAERIQTFSRQASRRMLRLQLRTVAAVTLSLLLLLASYLVLISDMGPALVIAVTFIMLYSIARRDILQMLLGVATYYGVAVLTHLVMGTSAWTMLAATVLWLVLWVGFWWLQQRAIYESAIMMNLLLAAFSLGGSLLQALHIDSASRLMARISMMGNGVWNNTVAGGDQVAQAIWALASGGLTGQGLGRGNANLIPAFHTDMMLASIGEVLGFVAVVVVILAITALVHHSMIVARRAAHPFAFFLLTGIALVTGVQFIVIAAGSVGLIPLTGVAVPLLSYGKSSLIINLAAFGLIVSASRYRPSAQQRQYVQRYDGAIIGSTLVVLAFAAVLVGTVFHYQVSARDEMLLHEARITTVDGERIIEHNPRIRLLMRQLTAGNIYDRRGQLLATSTPQGREYAYGPHLLFMLGDANTQILTTIDDDNPYGYLAESRHQGDLRGFDIYARDSKGQILYDTLTAYTRRLSPFMPAQAERKHVRRHDYSYLLPMLRQGIDGELVQQHNSRRQERDLYLTVDASLQVALQKRLAELLPSMLSRLNREARSKVRASVVVLDAEQGDLLASALYPLPNEDTIAVHFAEHEYVYHDRAGVGAYTERDLGLTYPTQPGSTAKVVTAMAALAHDPRNANRTFWIEPSDVIEPPSVEPHGRVSMRDAIVRSSNCYFIRIAHGDTVYSRRRTANLRTDAAAQLYPDLAQIYTATGMTVNRPQQLTPYYLQYTDMADERRTAFYQQVQQLGSEAMHEYRLYWQRHDKVRRNGHAGQLFWKMNMHATAMPWGQGDLAATPLAMARAVATVANGGQLVPTRYVLGIGSDEAFSEAAPSEPVRLISTRSASSLASFMRAETAKHRAKTYGAALQELDPQHTMGGKTGTPERGSNKNDGWYIAFIRSASSKHHLAIALRLERIDTYGSPKAVEAMANIVVPVLKENGY